MTALLVGMLLGCIFFGGLRWTLEHLWLARLSLAVRLTILGAGLLWPARQGATQLVLALVGILAARAWWVRRELQWS
ncbi:MAG: hypothetical protein KC910_23885 [Candidatus Eremiobacteraeota bacterium]|nr:hypothetical protein [Candidatus Eremiobacteraeota bacterium]